MVNLVNLVIVESPTKARTLAKFLGQDYQIEASYGHVRDLPEKKLGIDVEHEFRPDYVQTKKQKEKTLALKRLSAGVQNLYLATDPDREGEAIAWHISEVLREKKKVLRVTFHEITKSAIDKALENPGEINMQLVDAQQARRILDRLVGYKLSPLLWKKVRKGLSAGRVQSVAVRLVVEKEREIEAFKPVEYWDLQVILQKSVSSAASDQLTVKLVSPEVGNQDEAEKAERELRSRDTEFIVDSVEKKEFRRTPPASYTTSTLQQAGANKLGWSAKKTMQMAQNLYEMGLITYHRTDSTNIAAEAAEKSKEFIVGRYGNEYALERPRVYKTKSKVAQEAHEAIRPTDVSSNQLSVNSNQLNRDQERLYELIWKRFVACQMAEAVGESVKIVVGAGDYKLEARGETIKFMGWQKVYEKQSMTMNDDSMTINDNQVLPQVSEGEKLEFVDLTSEQKFTQPPARYNDASLIKALEEMGIGRPSTYAPTLSTIEQRQYVEKIEKRFKPTELGVAVNDFLVTNFSDIVDYKFTALMEDELDEIANGKRQWQPVIGEFYEPFEKKLEVVAETAERVKVVVEETGNVCPKCGKGQEIVRLGKFGKFLACSRFPDCDYKANYQNKTGQKCVKCGGDVIMRKTRSGKTFFGCSNYPKCDFASWSKPK